MRKKGIVIIMIEIEDKAKCCGCCACQNACPVHCIEMIEDVEGFYYPQIDREKCISCGKCERVCPVLKKHQITRKDSGLQKENNITSECAVTDTSYIAVNKDEQIRMDSSSGGIFNLLGEYILESHGVVFGAAFESDFTVRHIMVERKEDLWKLRGSKYVQSQMGDTYTLVKQQLEKKTRVLFSGTPCQVAGLKEFLEKDYENLFTVDVLCHGVPSGKVFGKYLEERKKEYGADLTAVNFRYKSTGWKKYSVRLEFDGGKEYVKRAGHDPYMQIFLSNIALRPSCYDCQFKGTDRASDLTMGDAWGVDDYRPDMDDDKGTSIIWLHSEKGVRMFEQMEQHISFVQDELDKILPVWSESRKSVSPHEKREIFFAKLNNENQSVIKLSKMVKPRITTRAYYKARGILKKIVKK